MSSVVDRLNRTTLTTSRLLDFASKKELIAQTGHGPRDWPLVTLKELVDNSLDACEEAGIAPKITVTVDASGITVSDNGPGLPAETIIDVLDFMVRVSSREAYVSPTRGAQGNALKTLVAMPFVLDGESGKVEIEAHDIRHTITFRVDRIRQEPLIDRTLSPSDVKIGTVVRVHWPVSACLILENVEPRFLQIAEDYAWLNPHLTMRVTWFGRHYSYAATNPTWSKWKPSDPTSPHWYTPEHLERLIAGYVTHDKDRGQDRTLREFVSEFRGLSSSAKQKAVLEAAGLSRARLSDLVQEQAIDRKAVEALLTAMKAESQSVKPEMLGLLGKRHLEVTARSCNCAMDSFSYTKEKGINDGVPWSVEVAFGYCPGLSNPRIRIVTGVNWSPGIMNPFRHLGGRSLDSFLGDLMVQADDPVFLAIHYVCPRVQYTDRGKSALVL